MKLYLKNIFYSTLLCTVFLFSLPYAQCAVTKVQGDTWPNKELLSVDDINEKLQNKTGPTAQVRLEEAGNRNRLDFLTTPSQEECFKLQLKEVQAFWSDTPFMNALQEAGIFPTRWNIDFTLEIEKRSLLEKQTPPSNTNGFISLAGSQAFIGASHNTHGWCTYVSRIDLENYFRFKLRTQGTVTPSSTEQDIILTLENARQLLSGLEPKNPELTPKSTTGEKETSRIWHWLSGFLSSSDAQALSTAPQQP